MDQRAQELHLELHHERRALYEVHDRLTGDYGADDVTGPPRLNERVACARDLDVRMQALYAFELAAFDRRDAGHLDGLFERLRLSGR
jgi:hypothetical protein